MVTALLATGGGAEGWRWRWPVVAEEEMPRGMVVDLTNKCGITYFAGSGCQAAAACYCGGGLGGGGHCCCWAEEEVVAVAAAASAAAAPA